MSANGTRACGRIGISRSAWTTFTKLSPWPSAFMAPSMVAPLGTTRLFLLHAVASPASASPLVTRNVLRSMSGTARAILSTRTGARRSSLFGVADGLGRGQARGAPGRADGDHDDGDEHRADRAEDRRPIDAEGDLRVGLAPED